MNHDFNASFAERRQAEERLTYLANVELRLLAAAMLKPDECSLLGAGVREIDLVSPAAAAVLDAIVTIEERGALPTLEAVRRAAFAHPDLTPVGGAAHFFARIVDLADGITPALFAEDARLIRDQAARRRLDAVLVAARAQLATSATSEPVERELRAFLDAHELLADPDGRAWSDLIDARLKADADRAAGLAVVDTAPTGFVELDRLLAGGLQAGRLYILGGRPGMGKSTLLTALALGVARGRADAGVLIYSLEMGDLELAGRAIGSEAGIQYDWADGGRLGTGQTFEAWRDGAERLRGLELRVDDRAGITPARIAAGARRYARQLAYDGRRLAAVLLDHSGFVDAEGRVERQDLEVGKITRAAKALAKGLRCAVVLVHQLNRGVESRDDKRPHLADLRDSGRVEQDADVVMFCYRDAYYARVDLTSELGKHKDKQDAKKIEELETRVESKVLEVIVAKNRSGRCDTVKLHADMGTSAVMDAPPEHPANTQTSEVGDPPDRAGARRGDAGARGRGAP